LQFLRAHLFFPRLTTYVCPTLLSLNSLDDADEEPDWLRDWGSAKAQEAQASSVIRLEEAQARLQDRLHRAVLHCNLLHSPPKITVV